MAWLGFWLMIGIIVAAKAYSQAMITCAKIDFESWNKADKDDEDED